MNCNVFVYGTLMYPEIVQALTEESIGMCDALLPHYARYKIHQPGRDAKGPVIIQQPHSTVEGKVLLDVSPRIVTILDKFELAASGYKRVKEIAYRLMDGAESEMVVQTYRAEPEVKEYLWGEWTKAEFESNGYLEYYLEKRIPALVEKWKANREYPELDS